MQSIEYGYASSSFSIWLKIPYDKIVLQGKLHIMRSEALSMDMRYLPLAAQNINGQQDRGLGYNDVYNFP